MEGRIVFIFLLVGYACSYEWHFGNDNPNYVHIEYLEGNIWPLVKTNRVTISVSPCMMVKYVWVAVVNLISNPSITYNKDTYTVVIENGLLASSTSSSRYHVVAKGMRDPSCRGDGMGRGDLNCPPQHCPVPNCPSLCILPNESPRCPPATCPPVYCPPPSCPLPNCPRTQCPLLTCPPAYCYPPYVAAQCPRLYCASCPQPQCFNQQHRNQTLSGRKKQKKDKAEGKRSHFGRQRTQTVIWNYIDNKEMYDATDKKKYTVIDGNGYIIDQEPYDFEDDDYSEDETNSKESNNDKLIEVKRGEGGEKHDLMLLIVSDKKDGVIMARERETGNRQAISSRAAKKIVYTENSGYNNGIGYGGDDLYGRNSGEATGSGIVKSIGYIKGLRYDWDDDNAEESVYGSRDRGEHKLTIDYDGTRGNSGGSDKDNGDSDRDWGYGYDANVFYPRKIQGQSE